jgi:putative DNA-invertase from lambdoid prophage Rac
MPEQYLIRLRLVHQQDDIGSEVLFFTFSLAAKIERSMMSARTKSALSKKRTEGVKLGRKVGFRQLDAIKDDVIEYRKKGLNFQSIAILVNSNRQTVANYLKEIGQYNK